MPPKPSPALTRFWPKVEITAECWIWIAALHRNGYGKFYIDGRVRPAHRVAYELLVGPVPEGLDLDHLCRIRACVNPDHLEPVTRRENLLRGATVVARRARQTHCKNGHEFSPENTITTAKGTRECRRCHADREARRRKRLKVPKC